MESYKKKHLPISIKLFLTSGTTRVLLILVLLLLLWMAIFWSSTLP